MSSAELRWSPLVSGIDLHIYSPIPVDDMVMQRTRVGVLLCDTEATA